MMGKYDRHCKGASPRDFWSYERETHASCSVDSLEANCYAPLLVLKPRETAVISVLPRTMKAAVIDAPGPAETLRVVDVPVPRLGHDHVLIALKYAGVGIWDAEQRSGAFGKVVPETILGTDGMGTIGAVGANVRDFAVGDRVYSYSYGNPHGFYAEYVNVAATHVSHLPTQIDDAVGGGMPCVAVTALTGLEALKLKPKQTLLVYGASGGVGSLAVWLANVMGATVIASARPDAHAYVRELGAAHAIDPYSSELDRVIKREAPDGFDAVLITAGGSSLSTFLSHLKLSGSVAYPNGVEDVPQDKARPPIAYDGESTPEAFRRLNAMIGSRTIPLRIETFSLDDVVRAHRRVEQGHVIGKVVLRINS
jgi:NADPH2:quinone reductase